MHRLNRQIPVTTSGRTHPYHPNVRPRFSSSLFYLACFCCTLLRAQAPVTLPYDCNQADLDFAGATCSDDAPCPIFLEFSSITTNGQKLFATGNLHTESATIGSVLVASEDGITWKEAGTRVRGAVLDQIQFFDAQHGWAAGGLQNPLARGPFFLITSDGGTLWRNRPVGDEDAPGSILRFAFDSVSHGAMVIDAGKTSAAGRYLSYESETGGESWSILGKTDTVPRRPLAPENDSLRISQSKDGKNINIEQHAGDTWSVVASFVVEVARCKVAEQPTPEPPADEPAKK